MAPADSSSADPTFDADALARQGRFVRALARGLVRDVDAADELTARAIAAAVAQRPDMGPSFRVWLERVTRRLFHRDQRERDRRERREHAAATRESTRSTLDLVAEMELQKQVAAAFERLEEPSKSALFLRYFHDRTPTEIAAQLGVPLATVKSRLQRGLQQLRERLDVAHEGKRDAWLGALLPWIGGSVVTTKSKLAPIAVAALLVGGASFVWIEVTRNDDVAAHRSQSVAAESAAAPASTPAEELHASPPTAERAPVAVDPSALPFAAGVVLDPQGAPLAGVAVVAAHLPQTNDPTAIPCQPAFEYADLATDTLATTDAAGRFAVAEPGERLLQFWFVKRGYGIGQWWDLAPERSANQDVRVILTPSRKVRGTVLDTDGHPIPRAQVGIGVELDLGQPMIRRVARHLDGAPQYDAPPGVGWQRDVADDEGRFDLGCVPLGRCFVSAQATHYNYASVTVDQLTDPWNPVLVRSDMLVDVVDADTDEPIPDASALLIAKKSRELLAMGLSMWNGEGDSARRVGDLLSVQLGYHLPAQVPHMQFTPPWLRNPPGQTIDVELHAIADGYRSDFVELTLTTAGEPPHLRIALEPDAALDGVVAISGRVTGGAAASVKLYVPLPGWEESTLLSAPPLLAANCGEDGDFAFRELPHGRYLLVARAAETAAILQYVDAPCEGIVLEPPVAGSLDVLVTDRSGAPAKRSWVQVQDESGREARMKQAGSDGIVRFRNLPIGRYRGIAFPAPDQYVFSERSQSMQKEVFAASEPVDVASGPVAELALPLLERTHVRVHFQHDDGTPVTRVALEWGGWEGPGYVVGTEYERLQAMQLELDSQGDASLDLFPATYFFAARESTVRRRITLVVPRDPEASLTARLPDRGPSGSIRVLLLDSVASQPIRFCKVRAIGGKRPTFVDLGEQTSDLEGRVSFDDVPIGEVELRLEPGRTPGTDDDFDNPAVPYGPTTRRLVVERDRVTELEIRVPPVKWKDAPIQRIHLEARVIEAAGGAPIQDALVEVHVIRDDGYDFAGKVRTAADGTARAEILRSERYEVSISTRWGPAPPKYKWKDLELEPKDGVLTVEAALEPRPPEEK